MYSYTPTYYSTLHDSITSLCKTILPFSFKKRRLPAAEQKLSKLQSDNLKWQQDSFHQILKLMGLCKEGILAEHEVSSFRSHLLETLIASPADQEQPVILRDKLLFLQVVFAFWVLRFWVCLFRWKIFLKSLIECFALFFVVGAVLRKMHYGGWVSFFEEAFVTETCSSRGWDRGQRRNCCESEGKFRRGVVSHWPEGWTVLA